MCFLPSRRCPKSAPFLFFFVIFLYFHILPPNFWNSEIHLYNLMEESKGAEKWTSASSSLDSYCSIEFANANRLQQDHPCVLEIIRKSYLNEPAPRGSLNLSFPTVLDPSSGQSKMILSHLKNQSGAFFVECGALDGEYGSNTLFMERYLHWNGILIEANKELFREVLAKRRHAWALPVCLSTEPYPTKIMFSWNLPNQLELSKDHIQFAPYHPSPPITKVQFDANDEAGKIYEPIKTKGWSQEENISDWLIEVQCFPLYSILLAVGRTRVDYFSLDVEGSEIKILKNIPWKNVDIRTLTVEITSRSKQVMINLTKFMEKQGYENVGLMDGPGYYDIVFRKR